ncbi:MAG TPA: hypothetical protein VFK82_11845 [Burkholderiaceae bacterium]|nr:hypothetical protein [Burkholderiaceae bacterium]
MRLVLSFLPGCILMVLVSLTERCAVHAEFVHPRRFGRVLAEWHAALSFGEAHRFDDDLAELIAWTGNV